MKTCPRSTRGVTLIEGLISTVILLIGMVGVLQGLAVASMQNSMANRHTRASIIAQELMGVVEQQGRARLLDSVSGLFTPPRCTAATSLSATTQTFLGDLNPLPPSLSGLGFTPAGMCFIDFDAQSAAFRALTPAYSTLDDTVYSRVIAVYQHPTDPSVLYVGVDVGWRDAGRVRIAKRFTAIYDTATNQTNLEF